MSYFYGVYPSQKETARLFDLARLIVQPDFARRTHITLRGPYERKPSHRTKWLKLQPSNATIMRPAKFFNDHQNTVFFGISFLEINDISWKKDFADSVPHMTIYDGNDRAFAWQVLGVLREFSWQFEIELTQVLVLERKKEVEGAFFLELDDIDMAFRDISEKPLSRSYIRGMHIGQRILYLRKICSALNSIGS